MSEENPQSERPVIFEFEDYRCFLKETYDFLKQVRPGFSFRSFARDANLSSPNYYKLVMDGKRNLTPKSISQFSKALGLKRNESDFFEILVHFNQANDDDTKNFYFSKLARVAGARDRRVVQRDEYEYYSNWYYSAVRELVNIEGFRDDPTWIARRVLPAITPRQAQEALELLFRLGFLKRDGGRIVQAEPTIASTPEVRSLAVSNFHRQMLSRASEAIESVPSMERDITALTLGVNESQIQNVKQRILEFRRELLEEIGGSEEASERVYQMSVQFFPLSSKGGEEE